MGWGENDRGVSFTFGEDVVAQFLRRHDLDLICRAHQVVEDGYEFFARRQLVTIFSAPNYCGEFDNAGAMMSVDDTLMCSFQILKPAEKKQRITQAGECKLASCGSFFLSSAPPPVSALSLLLFLPPSRLSLLLSYIYAVFFESFSLALFLSPPPPFYFYQTAGQRPNTPPVRQASGGRK